MSDGAAEGLAEGVTVPQVCLVADDEGGWSCGEEGRLMRIAVSGVAATTDLSSADVVHALGWHALRGIAPSLLTGKHIVSCVGQDVSAFLATPESIGVRQLVGRWVARSDGEAARLRSVGIDSAIVPQMIDRSVFRPLRDGDRDDVRAQWHIPEGRYLIGSFHREAEGYDPRALNAILGPDVFAQIVGVLLRRGLPVHALLAGPSRFQFGERLAELGVPFTFVDENTDTAVVHANAAAGERLNGLYNLIDLYLVTSASEGAAHAVLQASAAGCKLLSPRAGIAEDILAAECIYDSAPAAVEAIARDIRNNHLTPTIARHSDHVSREHTPETVSSRLADLYAGLATVPRFSIATAPAGSMPRPPTMTERLRGLIRRSGRRPATVALWHQFHKPPYGGGNQFMLALRKELRRRGVRVVENTFRRADVHLLQAVWFDVNRFRRRRASSTLRVIHRIDGPIELIRGTDREKDEELFRLNEEYAAATVIQSSWCYAQTCARGYRPLNPVIIHNAVDPDVFHARGRAPFARDRKIRIIATSWSDNVRKGGATYRWMDQYLDWDRFEFTFVGRVSEQFDHIRVLPPVGSMPLADLLRRHDLYVTASQNDPCSNALIEALSCGLPALYRNDGGHPELVGFGGLPFDRVEEIPGQLERLVDDYETFQRLIVSPDLREVTDRYLRLVTQVAC